jgi:hypothetical protein
METIAIFIFFCNLNDPERMFGDPGSGIGPGARFASFGTKAANGFGLITFLVPLSAV